MKGTVFWGGEAAAKFVSCIGMSKIRSAEVAVLALLITIVLCSCNLPSSRRGPAAAGFGDWNIYDSTIQIHSYSKEGLLDSSLEIYYHLRYGQPDQNRAEELGRHKLVSGQQRSQIRSLFLSVPAQGNDRMAVRCQWE
jgi:hypothetical protein